MARGHPGLCLGHVQPTLGDASLPTSLEHIPALQDLNKNAPWKGAQTAQAGWKENHWLTSQKKPTELFLLRLQSRAPVQVLLRCWGLPVCLACCSVLLLQWLLLLPRSHPKFQYSEASENGKFSFFFFFFNLVANSDLNSYETSWSVYPIECELWHIWLWDADANTI